MQMRHSAVPSILPSFSTPFPPYCYKHFLFFLCSSITAWFYFLSSPLVLLPFLHPVISPSISPHWPETLLYLLFLLIGFPLPFPSFSSIFLQNPNPLLNHTHIHTPDCGPLTPPATFDKSLKDPQMCAPLISISKKETTSLPPSFI